MTDGLADMNYTPAPFAIDVLQDGQAVYSVLLGDLQVMSGRAPGNGLVLSAGDISWHHAVFWKEGDQVWVNDLNSTNGTFLEGKRITEPTIVHPGERIRLGTNSTLQLRSIESIAPEAVRPPMVVEDVGSEISVPVLSDRFRIGPGPNADLRVEVPAEETATLVIFEDAEVFLGIGEEERKIELGEIFEACGRELRVRIAADVHAPTDVMPASEYPYTVTARLGAGAVAQATIADPRNRKSCLITAESRVALVYVLAKQLKHDRDRGLPLSQQGWVDDDDVGLGIWGRRWREHSKGHLNVVVHRVRKQLADSELDQWCIEKRRKRIRLRADEIVLD
ncbi:MAG: FHA domain-containing protein [Alphaproteobacteria bacterium]|nr:FHA domain-containing protein [Alphaproteobacteria bacterium]